MELSNFSVGTIEWDAILPQIKNELLEVIDKERRKLDQMFHFVSNFGAGSSRASHGVRG